ncbi:MAG: hypothetical protein EZS28_013210 [Streblomastix strix]|uniref:Uncharacterized protein n=1 Tax=Streblomastix strix TaxID=222440 RepID=A0A5J4W9S0_9EUKA|nr:MAG: hypothetical protein EZS28_013210 [Streblomastix strix]
MGQPQKVNHSDNDSNEHTDNEMDHLVRARAEIPFDDFIDSMDGNSEEDNDYAASPVSQSTEDDNLDVQKTSGGEEVHNANIELKLKLAPTAKKNQKYNRKAAIRLITSRINQKTKDYDPLVPEFDEDHIKALRERSTVDISPLNIIKPPKIVEGEKTPLYGSLIKNLVATQSTNVLTAKTIFQKGKLEAAERILDTFELIGQATGEAQQLRKQHLDHRSSRFSYNKPPTSAAYTLFLMEQEQDYKDINPHGQRLMKIGYWKKEYKLIGFIQMHLIYFCKIDNIQNSKVKSKK